MSALYANRPRVVRVVDRGSGTVICERCAVADTPLGRLHGLLGRSGLQPGEGLLIQPANSIHTLFMRFPIDVVFLDKAQRVVGVAARVKPWRAAVHRGARSALELRSGECGRRGVREGLVLSLEHGAL